MPPSLRVLSLAALLTAPCLPVSSSAKSSEWKDAAGATFKAEPVEVLGPFGLLRSGGGGRRVMLRGLSAEDCVRFYRDSAARPPRADDWSQAKGAVSREFVRGMLRVENKQLVPAVLAGRPEPEVFVVLYASHNDGESWFLLRNFQPTYRRIQEVYPGRCEALLFGVREDESQHKRIAVESSLPWLVTDFRAQSNLGVLTRFAPGEGVLMLAISRDGVPLVSSPARNVQEVKRFVDELTDVLRSSDPDSPATWRDRKHYLDAVRPVEFAASASAPVLVGNPLRADGLRQRGVTGVAAQLEVGPDGKVTAARIAANAGVPENLRAPLADALVKGAQFSPAIDHGRAVAGTFDYRFSFPAQETRSAADAAWVRGDARIEVPIKSWFVLKPVEVPPSVFSAVGEADASGTRTMTEYVATDAKVSKASQMNSFNTDWFTDSGGADSVVPVEGAKVTIGENELTWRTVTSADGYVDLQTFERRDYCIGYAATEIDLPQALDGWLGIGSDDGLKIWLNGELVHDRWVRRISQVDDDIVPLKFKAGRNRILIKVQNATGDWSFIARLRLRQP